MQYRTLALGAFVSLAVLAACSDDDSNSTSPNTNATVRFVNATGNSNLSVAENGVVGTGNSSLGFGSGSSCMTVNASNPNLTFTDANGAMINGFTPTFLDNGNYTVVAYTDANGNTQFATLDNSYTPTTGQAGLRVFNGAYGSGNIVLNSNGTALNDGTTTAFGNTGTFFSTPAGTSDLMFNTGTGTATAADLGNVTLNAGQNTTVVIGPAASGSSNLRAFYTAGC